MSLLAVAAGTRASWSREFKNRPRSDRNVCRYLNTKHVRGGHYRITGSVNDNVVQYCSLPILNALGITRNKTQ